MPLKYFIIIFIDLVAMLFNCIRRVNFVRNKIKIYEQWIKTLPVYLIVLLVKSLMTNEVKKFEKLGRVDNTKRRAMAL